MKSNFFSSLVLVVALSFLAGCVINAKQRNVRASHDDSEAESDQFSSAALSAKVAQINAQAQAQAQPVAQPPKPRIEERVGQRFSVAPAQLEAPNSMAVHLYNTSQFFGCVVSPTVNGAPVYRMRYGNYEQDFLPTHPGWEHVRCAAVLLPNVSGRPETAPEAWLAVRYPGTFKLMVDFYTYDGVSPQPLPGSTFATTLSFPNTFRRNGACMPSSLAGCLYNVYLQATAEFDGDMRVAGVVNLVPLDLLHTLPVESQLALMRAGAFQDILSKPNASQLALRTGFQEFLLNHIEQQLALR